MLYTVRALDLFSKLRTMQAISSISIGIKYWHRTKLLLRRQMALHLVRAALHMVL